MFLWKKKKNLELLKKNLKNKTGGRVKFSFFFLGGQIKLVFHKGFLVPHKKHPKGIFSSFLLGVAGQAKEERLLFTGILGGGL